MSPRQQSVFERFFPLWATQIGLGLVFCGFGYDSNLAKLLGVTLLFTLLVVYS